MWEQLTPGMKVLDVGCGPGTITKGMADKVGPHGQVIGIDISEELILKAQQEFKEVPNLQFIGMDVFEIRDKEGFDLITAARVLQWLAHPEKAVYHLAGLLKKGGILSILDYNHEKLELRPYMPATMQKVYDQFLRWRADVGFDNQIADHLEEMFQRAGLKHIETLPYPEITQKGEADFWEKIHLWKEVAEKRGPQLVKDGYIQENERVQSIDDYSTWMQEEANYMKLYLCSVVGKND